MEFMFFGLEVASNRRFLQYSLFMTDVVTSILFHHGIWSPSLPELVCFLQLLFPIYIKSCDPSWRHDAHESVAAALE